MPNKQVHQRANRAARILEQLTTATLELRGRHGCEWRFASGEWFDGRAYDLCFEMGDGGEVVARLLTVLDARPDLLAKLQPGCTPASDFVALDTWRERYGDPKNTVSGQLVLL